MLLSKYFKLIAEVSPKSNATCVLDLKYAGDELTFNAKDQPKFLERQQLKDCMVISVQNSDGRYQLRWKKNNELVSTQYMKGKRPGRAAYAIDKFGQLYIHEHINKHSHPDEIEPFYHSSFLSGRAGKCFGLIEVKNGYIVHLDNYSGHYRPSADHLQDAHERLKHAMSDNCEVKYVGLPEDPNATFGIDTLFI